MPFIMQAQEYISIDETTSEGRLVRTKPRIMIAGGNVYVMAFNYSDFITNHVYYATIVCTNENAAWKVNTGDTGSFRMIKGENVLLKTIMESQSERNNDGTFTNTVTYIIPDKEIHNMLNSLTEITLNVRHEGAVKTIRIPIGYDDASFLMLSYLELLSRTGK